MQRSGIFIFNMDSIINNTSWAFIKSLGYEITDYSMQTLNSVDSEGSTITVPTFNIAFIDFISTSKARSDDPRYTSFTVRPYICHASDSGKKEPFSMWGESGTSNIYIKPYDVDNSLLRYIEVVNNTTITMYTGGSTFSHSDIMVFFYVVE